MTKTLARNLNQKEHIEIPKFLSEAGRRRTKIRKCTAQSWANVIAITEEEFNRCLEKLGYQYWNSKTLQWEITQKALQYSKSLFGKTYWDIDVCRDVLRLRECIICAGV